MSKPTHSESMEPSGPNGDQKPTPGNSIEQRRNALRRVGQAAAAAGVTSPMAALATGTGGRQRACNPPKTNKVHATISGCKSVLLSGQSGNQCYGKPCSWYKTTTNIPSSCQVTYWDSSSRQWKMRAKVFSEIFVCTGRTDSNGKRSGQSGCYFDKGIDTLCAMTTPPVEAHWAIAYCNSQKYYSLSNFPYSPSEVQGHWTSQNGDAYCFYTDFMEAG